MCSLGKLAVLQVDSPVQPAGFVSVPVPALDPDPVPATVPEEVCCSSLLFLLDILSDRVFLVDSGASLSVFPGPGSTSSDGVRLHTADGSLMYCSGTRITPLYFSCGSDSRFYSWNFQLALVSVPLLGADFLQHFNLLVDVKGHWLVHAKCLESIVIQPAPDPSASRSSPPSFQTLSPPTVLPPPSHHLLTKLGPTVHAKPRRLDPEKLAAAKVEFFTMEKAGIIRRSSSHWSSPLHMVKKKDRGWRPCGDYRRLNNVTVPDRYPLPNIADFTS